MRTRERSALLGAAAVLVVLLPALNALPPGSPFRISDFTLNLFGKFLCYAILALGIDLIWGYTGVLSLGHGVFFGLGAYAMGMHLMLEIGTQSVYKNVLPDFMVWNQVKELPLFWRPFYSGVVHDPRGVGGSGGGGLRLRLPHLPEPHPRRLLLDHHPGDGALRLAPVQPQLAESRRDQWPVGLQECLRLHAERRGHPARALRGHGAVPLRRLSAVPRHHAVPRGQGAGGHPGQRDARALLGLLARRLQALRLRHLGDTRRRGRGALRAAGGDHHAGQDRRAALHRDDHLGGGRRAGDAARADRRRLRGELAAEHPHHELSRPVAARPGRDVRRRRALLPRRRGGDGAEAHRPPVAAGEDGGVGWRPAPPGARRSRQTRRCRR